MDMVHSRTSSMLVDSLPMLPEALSTSSTALSQSHGQSTHGNPPQDTMNPPANTQRSKSTASLGGRSHQSLLSAPSSATHSPSQPHVGTPSTAKSTATSLSAVNDVSPELAAARSAAAALAAMQHPFTLSPGELAAAFTCLSTDGQRVTRTDIRDFLDFYFPDMPDKLERTLLGGNNKEDREIGLATLLKIMSKKKDMAVCTYQDVGKAVASGLRVPTVDGVVMGQQAVRACVERITERAPIRAPTDLGAVMARFDADGDGAVGVEDWKAVRAMCDEHPRLIRLLDTL